MQVTTIGLLIWLRTFSRSTVDNGEVLLSTEPYADPKP